MAGAPETGAVAPGVYVVEAPHVVPLLMPEKMEARAGTSDWVGVGVEVRPTSLAAPALPVGAAVAPAAEAPEPDAAADDAPVADADADWRLAMSAWRLWICSALTATRRGKRAARAWSFMMVARDKRRDGRKVWWRKRGRGDADQTTTYPIYLFRENPSRVVPSPPPACKLSIRMICKK